MLYFFLAETFLFGVVVGILINLKKSQCLIEGWERALEGWEQAVNLGKEMATQLKRADEVIKNLGDLIHKKSMTEENTAGEGKLNPPGQTNQLVFGEALELLKEGRRLCRAGWNGKGMWVALQTPDEYSKMGLPYLYMSTVDGKLVPWLASQTDLLAEDWEVVGEGSGQPVESEGEKE